MVSGIINTLVQIFKLAMFFMKLWIQYNKVLVEQQKDLLKILLFESI
jgi:succinate dehydrogenase hydrophobic anchor subunit